MWPRSLFIYVAFLCNLAAWTIARETVEEAGWCFSFMGALRIQRGLLPHNQLSLPGSSSVPSGWVIWPLYTRLIILPFLVR